jgi:hypothetical protein
MRLLVALSALVAVVGCNGDAPEAPDRPITAVAVTPGTQTLLAGQTLQLSAAVTGGYGTPTVTWKSSNLAVASVSAAGLVTANIPGTATITASSGGIDGTAVVIVGAASVAVSPGTSALVAGQTVQLAAAVTGVLGTPSVSWQSSNPLVASVSATGLVTGNIAGTATITASSSGASAATVVTVTNGAIDRVSVCDRSQTSGCVPSATLNIVGLSVLARATAYNTFGVDISSACVFSWSATVAGRVSISFVGDATKRDALITRTSLGSTTLLVTCPGSEPGVFTISGPEAPTVPGTTTP